MAGPKWVSANKLVTPTPGCHWPADFQLTRQGGAPQHLLAAHPLAGTTALLPLSLCALPAAPSMQASRPRPAACPRSQCPSPSMPTVGVLVVYCRISGVQCTVLTCPRSPSPSPSTPTVRDCECCPAASHCRLSVCGTPCSSLVAGSQLLIHVSAYPAYRAAGILNVTAKDKGPA